MAFSPGVSKLQLLIYIFAFRIISLLKKYETYSVTAHNARIIPGQSPNVYPPLAPASDQQQLQLQQLQQQLALNSTNEKARNKQLIHMQ